MENMMLVFFIGVLIYVCYGIVKAIERLKVRVYRKIFPLDQRVEMKIDREMMNTNYYQLNKDEIEILEKTDKCPKVYITRKVKNELVVTVEGEGNWTVFQASPNEISDNWVRYFKRSYFTRPVSFGKAIAFKRAMI